MLEKAKELYAHIQQATLELKVSRYFIYNSYDCNGLLLCVLGRGGQGTSPAVGEDKTFGEADTT